MLLYPKQQDTAHCKKYVFHNNNIYRYYNENMCYQVLKV